MSQSVIAMGHRPSQSCVPTAKTGTKSLALPVLPAKGPVVRASRMGPRRAAVLIGVHVIMIAHFCHWIISGRTVSPVEPSEAMYTLNHGHLNAGFLFFAAAIAATALLGRFVCGWGCHFVAYQDLASWILKKVGIKPKPFRSRLLVLAPLALALYMFVWPTAYRLVTGSPFPTFTNHLITGDFWATFPGPVVGILTVLFVGMAIVYFLGAKGFCTYACPYGGFFGVVDRVAPGRIRVTDACEHCGHCTAVCTSNVRVHEEVALFGMVVDPGCMKCMDCVSVCPNDALYFGFSATRTDAQVADVAPQRRPTPYDFSIQQEMGMAVIGLGALFALRGLYDQIPLLLAMGLAAITGFLAIKLFGLVRDANVRLQNLQLKRGGTWTWAGLTFATMAAMWLCLVMHSGFVQFAVWHGSNLVRGLQLGDDIWQPGVNWRAQADPGAKVDHASAIGWLGRADRYGIGATTEGLNGLAWLAVAENKLPDASRYLQRILARIPNRPEPWRALALLHLKGNQPQEAEQVLRAALVLDPSYALARLELAVLLAGQGRGEESAVLYRDAINLAPNDSVWPVRLARGYLESRRWGEAEEVLAAALERLPADVELLTLAGAVRLGQGRTAEGMASLQRAIAINPRFAEAYYNLGMAFLGERRIDDAMVSLRRAVAEAPLAALYHYNLAVATFMAGRPAEAEPIIMEAIRLNPNDADAQGFLEVVQEHLAPSPATP